MITDIVIDRDALRSDIRKLAKQPTATQWTSIEDRRRRLETRLDNFQKKAMEYIGNLEEDEEDLDILPQFTGFEDPDQDGSDYESLSFEGENADEYEYEYEDEDEDEDDNGPECPETTVICMPSSFKREQIEALGIQDLARQELELRKGQANDCLKDLRLALGHKAVLYRTKVRGANTSVGKTKAWDDIKAITRKVNKHVTAYRRARKALERLGADETIMDRYQELLKEDLRLSGDITEENRLGQRNETLPWFWRLDGKNVEETGAWMEECEHYFKCC